MDSLWCRILIIFRRRVVTAAGLASRGSLSPTSSVANFRANRDAAVHKFSVFISSFLLVKSRLHDRRRIEQNGFTPKRSTIDHILTLNMIYQQRREFNQPLWVAYVNLKAAFDSVDRTALWQLLLSVGLPHRIVELFKALYTDTVSCVRADGCESGFR